MAETKQKEAIGALWIKKSKSGVTYLSGVLQKGEEGKKTPIVIFKNRKGKDTHPDYRIYLSDPKPQEGGQEEEEIAIEDIPF